MMSLLLLLTAPAAALAVQPAAVCSESVLLQRHQTAELVGRQSPEPPQPPAGQKISALDEEGRISLALASASSRSNLSRRTFGSSDGTTVNGVCVDYTAEGYFSSRGNYQEGVAATFVDRPATLSQCELEQLHVDCVDRINMYRTGALRFSDGTIDSNVAAGLSVLSELTGNNQCSNHQALGDLVYAKPLGFGCAVGHYTAFSCGGGAQNSCCAWHQETTYSGVKQKLFDCLQSMWDEGITEGEKGHWQTMRNPSYAYASCGFGWNEDGKMNMNQDFYVGEEKQPCSCEGRQPGDPDGCGGRCAACSEPVVEPCTDKEEPRTCREDSVGSSVVARCRVEPRGLRRSRGRAARTSGGSWRTARSPAGPARWSSRRAPGAACPRP